MSDEVAVLGCGAFVAGYDGLAGFARGTTSRDHDVPKAELVPLRQRRRASVLSKALADAYAESLAGTGLDLATVESVFGSALGEATTMIGLLGQMYDGAATLSPMRFATSVHNAASGMISIATDNRGMTTAIGADYDTPAMALLEGMGLALARKRAVVVCCGDEAPPEDFVSTSVGWSLMAAAIVIGPVDHAPIEAPRLSGLTIAPGDLDAPHVADSIARNPNIGLLDLVVAISRGAEGVLRLDRGAGRGYSIRLHASRP
jgi:hypothetical protein